MPDQPSWLSQAEAFEEGARQALETAKRCRALGRDDWAEQDMKRRDFYLESARMLREHYDVRPDLS